MSDFLKNPDALANIKQLLNRTGAPLETRVARIAGDFNRWSNRTAFDGLTMSSGRLLYGDTEETALREIDQSILVSAPIVLDTDDDYDVDVSLNIHVLIECKHRDGLAVFGFPHDTFSGTSAVCPMVTDFARTPLLNDLRPLPPIFSSAPICTVGLLDNMHKQPRISDEQLIYKAGASLYDAIRFMAAPFVETGVEQGIEELGLLEKYKAYAERRGGASWSNVTSWMGREISDELCRTFNQQYYQTRPFTAWFVAFIPIICVDAPLYIADVADDGEIKDIVPQDFLLTSLRLSQWPGILAPHLTHPRPESLVAIVNVENLPDVLDSLADWYSMLGTFFGDKDSAVVQRLPLEMAFLNSIRHELSHDDLLRAFWHLQ